MRRTAPLNPGLSKPGLVLLAPVLLLGISCSTPSKDKAQDVLPSIAFFKASTADTVPAWAKTAQETLPLTIGGTAYLKATFSSVGGRAVLTPGNLPLTTGQAVTVGPINATTTYTVTLTDDRGHVTTRTATIVAVDAPDATITAPTSAITGTTGLQASVATVAGSTYKWDISNGTITAGKLTPVVTFTAGIAGNGGASNTLQLTCTVTNISNTNDIKSANVTVNANPPSGLSYPAASVQAHVGVPFTAVGPTLVGGDPVQTYTVSPALPAGLTLNATTGVISGTPTAQTPSGVYHVSATNSGGTATFDLTLTVGAQPSASFLAASPTIGLGGGTVLNWTVDASVDSITVDHGIQTTPLDTTTVKSGAFPVSPTSSTTYTLTANLGGGGSFNPAAATVTVDATPFTIATFTTDAPQSVVPYGGGANLHWTLNGVPVALTVNGSSVLGTLGTTVSPVRRQVFTLAGENGLSAQNTDSKTLAVAAQGLDLLAGHYSGPGYRDAQGTSALFNGPYATAMDAAGNLFVADSGSHVIRMVDSTGLVTTIGGVPGTTGTTDGALGTSLFFTPRGLAVTADGQTLFVADWGNHTIRKMVKGASGWTVSTVAGTPGTFGANDGVGNLAQFDNPCGLCLDDPANPHYLYVADYFKCLIRQVDVAPGPTYATVITYAGTGSFGHVDVNNSFLGSAKFDDPVALCFGTVGGQKVLFVLDYFINSLRAITYSGPATVKATATSGMTGSVYSIAGSANGVTSGTFGFQDGTGSAAKFNNPNGLTIDGNGALYIADTSNNSIRKVVVPSLGAGTGVVTTVAGSATAGGQDNSVGTSAGFKGPQGAMATGNTLYVADGNGSIRTVDLSSGGTFGTSTVAGGARVQGSTNGLGALATFTAPVGVATDANGNAYVADTGNHLIRKVDAAGNATLLAGNPGVSGNTDTAAGTAAFKAPQGVAVDKTSGVVYVADTGNKSIRKIATDGTVTTVLSTGLSGPLGIVVDPTNPNLLWITDSNGTGGSSVNVVRQITLSGATGSVTLTVGTTSGSTDGAPGTAKFKFGSFSGLTADAAGNLYVADCNNHSIRKLTKASSYAVSTVSGVSGGLGFLDSSQGTPRFYYPQGIDLDASGNLYVADWGNHAVRKIDAGGAVTTIVGSSSTAGNVNGSPTRVGDFLGQLSSAGLINPQSLALTPSGDLLVVTNDAVLQVTAPNGQ